jgi:hypothetical protein
VSFGKTIRSRCMEHTYAKCRKDVQDMDTHLDVPLAIGF